MERLLKAMEEMADAFYSSARKFNDFTLYANQETISKYNKQVESIMRYKKVLPRKQSLQWIKEFGDLL